MFFLHQVCHGDSLGLFTSHEYKLSVFYRHSVHPVNELEPSANTPLLSSSGRPGTQRSHPGSGHDHVHIWWSSDLRNDHQFFDVFQRAGGVLTGQEIISVSRTTFSAVWIIRHPVLLHDDICSCALV